MKKSVLLASAAIMMCYFTSCGGGKKTEEAPAAAETTTEAAAPEYKLMTGLTFRVLGQSRTERSKSMARVLVRRVLPTGGT